MIVWIGIKVTYELHILNIIYFKYNICKINNK